MKMIIVPTKSRYELESERYSNEEIVRANFKSEEVWKIVKESHYAQKENIKKVKAVLGQEKLIDRGCLTSDVIKENNLFVILGGDNHFTYCAQNILEYVQDNPKEKKYVLGAVLDPTKSHGGLLYFTIDSFLKSLRRLEQKDFDIEKWSVLEAKVNNRNGIVKPYPAVGDYFIGEYSSLFMSRNLVYLNGEPLTCIDKSSGILIAIGAGSGRGSWYSNIKLSEEGRLNREDEIARLVLRESRELTSFTLRRGQTVTIDSYNDSKGIVSPDSQEEHSVGFNIGSRAEIKISDLKLLVIKNGKSI